VVCLPLGLSVVRRFDLSDQARYFFTPFKRTSKTKKQNKIIQSSKRGQQQQPQQQTNRKKVTMYK